MMAGRYAHAKQFRRHQRQLRIIRSRLGRIIREASRLRCGPFNGSQNSSREFREPSVSCHLATPST